MSFLSVENGMSMACFQTPWKFLKKSINQSINQSIKQSIIHSLPNGCMGYLFLTFVQEKQCM
jgi:hypothetical protein